MSHYRTGTISLTNGSLSVVGSGTDFISGAAVGECVSAPDGKIYEIASIQSATALTLGTVYLGSTSSGQAYSIVPTQSYLRDLALQAATLVNDYQSVLDSAGAGKFGDGTLGSPGIQFSSDSNSGIRRTGTDALAVVTGGVDRITVDAAGAVAVVASLSVAGSAVPTLTSTSTLTNKTLALGGNTISGTTAQFNTALTDGDFATLAGTETLTNKTLTSPDINGGTIDGAVIGGSSAAAGSFTTLNTTGTPTFDTNIGYIGKSGTGLGGNWRYKDDTGTSRWLAGLLGSGGATAFSIYDIVNAKYALQIAANPVEVGITTTGLTVGGTLSAAAGSFTTVSASTHATAQFFAMSAGLGSFPVAQGLYGYYSGGGVVAAYTNNSGTLATLSLDGTTIVFRPNGSAVGLFTTTGLEVTGALSCTGNTTLGDAAGDTLNVANGSLRLDASGNLGLGVTPSATGGAARSLDVGSVATFTSNPAGNTATSLTQNAYTDGTNWIYRNSSTGAALYQMTGANAGSTHVWSCSTGGTAGNTITFTQVLAVEKDKTLALQGATSATGCGIAFPATQVASSNANTLDDYEEGTWTPTQGAGLTVVGAFSSSGTYTKVGRQVTAYGQVTGATSVTAVAGTIMCGGLPFAAALQYQGVGANSTGATGFVVAVAGTNVWSADASSTSPTQCFSVTYTV